MRIAQVAPLTEAVPPTLYGGTEPVVHWLTEELVALGNDVTFRRGHWRTAREIDAILDEGAFNGSGPDPVSGSGQG
jgi:hypothetical protein